MGELKRCTMHNTHMHSVHTQLASEAIPLTTQFQAVKTHKAKSASVFSLKQGKNRWITKKTNAELVLLIQIYTKKLPWDKKYLLQIASSRKYWAPAPEASGECTCQKHHSQVITQKKARLAGYSPKSYGWTTLPTRAHSWWIPKLSN